MSLSSTSHGIKHREKPNDKFYTPRVLAGKLISSTPLIENDVVMEPFRGSGAFYDNLPDFVDKRWAEMEDGKDAFWFPANVDWIVTNPPYSMIDKTLSTATASCRKGFGLLLLMHAITPARLEYCQQRGFGLSTMFLTKVFNWYGISAYCIWRRGFADSTEITWDRIVWRSDEPIERGASL
jgi:hypothetical protein